jgi:hypothetical protein
VGSLTWCDALPPPKHPPDTAAPATAAPLRRGRGASVSFPRPRRINAPRQRLSPSGSGRRDQTHFAQGGFERALRPAPRVGGRSFRVTGHRPKRVRRRGGATKYGTGVFMNRRPRGSLSRSRRLEIPLDGGLPSDRGPDARARRPHHRLQPPTGALLQDGLQPPTPGDPLRWGAGVEGSVAGADGSKLVRRGVSAACSEDCESRGGRPLTGLRWDSGPVAQQALLGALRTRILLRHPYSARCRDCARTVAAFECSQGQVIRKTLRASLGLRRRTEDRVASPPHERSVRHN